MKHHDKGEKLLPWTLATVDHRARVGEVLHQEATPLLLQLLHPHLAASQTRQQKAGALHPTFLTTRLPPMSYRHQRIYDAF